MRHHGWTERELNPLVWAVKAALDQTGHASLVVHGGSMMPVIWPGSEVHLRRLERPPRIGECVLAVDAEGAPIVHRVVSVNGESLGLRGDAQRVTTYFQTPALLARVQGWNLGRWRFDVDAPPRLQRIVSQVLCGCSNLARGTALHRWGRRGYRAIRKTKTRG